MRLLQRPGRWLVLLVVIATTAVVGSIAVGGLTAASPQQHAKQDLVSHILKTSYLTPNARKALLFVAGLSDHALAGGGEPDFGRATPAQGNAPLAPVPPLGFTNVRVNAPSLDTFLDQTTQSETSIGVSGNNVVIGYNDSQKTLPALTAGSDITGYSYSSNRGATWTDGGALPNAAGGVNLGDPWLATDRAGRFYFSTLMFAPGTLELNIGVARSSNGGKTFSPPINVSPPDEFFGGDKEAITVGRNPKTAAQDDVYVSWDNFGCDPVDCFNSFFTGLVLARSTDAGLTWTTSYIDRSVQDLSGCSWQQYIGAQPLVDPKDGMLYVAAELIAVNDPLCEGAAATFSEAVFKSKDGGASFGARVKIGDVTPATQFGAVELGPGQFMRTIEFPVLAIFDNAIYAAWNGGSNATSDQSHIRLAKSTDGAKHWSLSSATSGTGSEFQPALSADSAGLHLTYYEVNGNGTLDVLVGNSTNGSSWSTKRVTDQSFPGVYTVPQFDPIIAFGYMGDYIANVSDGTDQYFAWGDNRDIVKNTLWPAGRNDPDVFFAKQ
jgi:hypothetical protein